MHTEVIARRGRAARRQGARRRRPPGAPVGHRAREPSIHHKDPLPVVYLTGDMAGHLDSPLCGLARIAAALDGPETGLGVALLQHFIRQPAGSSLHGLK